MSLPIGDISYKAPPPEGKPFEECLDVIYQTLFHPVKLFKEVDALPGSNSGRYFLYALLAVFLISGMNPVLGYILSGGEGATKYLLFQVPFQAVVGVIYWLMLSNVVGLITFALTGNGQFRKLLILSAFSFLPWMFLAPIALMKQGTGILGAIFGPFGTFSVLIWTLILYGLALGVIYKLTLERVLILMVAVLPFALMLGSVAWSINLMSSLFFRFA